MDISFNVNGTPHSVNVPPERLLVDLLRYDLRLTGTKEGCSVGVCGLCTVMVDGELATACLTLAATINGREVTTVEGIAENGKLHPVQQAFVERAAFQCGICTPGQIVAAKALLDRNPHPDEDEVKEWMMGNLCRCTGYYPIVEAIVHANDR